METINARQAPRTSRVPLDDVLIELSHDDFAERFEADGVNVGVGGLSMRAAILPDVGARLTCSFQSPADGAEVRAGCEVVWATDSGRYMGEFGLRFTEIDERSAGALRRIVSDWGELVDEGSSRDPGADEEDGGGGDPAEAFPQTIELRLEGVGSPLIAEPVRESTGSLVVEQELPFLRVGTGVSTEAGRSGRLDSVDLRMDGEMPRLVLTVRFGEEDVAEEAEEAVGAALPIEPPPQAREASVSGADVERDALDTIPDTAPAASIAEVAVPRPIETPELRARGREALRLELCEEDREPSAALGVTESTPLAEDERADEEPSSRGQDLVYDLRARIVPAVAAARAHVFALWARVLPALKRGLVQARASFFSARAQLRPLFERGVGRLFATARRFVDVWQRRRQGSLATKRRAQPRRTQRPRGQVSSANAKESSSEPAQASRRKAILGLLTVTVVALGAVGVMRSDGSASSESDAVAPVASKDSEAAPSPTHAGPAPSAYAAPAPTAYGGSTAPSRPEAAPASPEVPRALPEPDYQEGRMPAPTFPAVGEGRSSRGDDSQPATVQSFGAASVPDGMPFTLNMSTIVQGISGEESDRGFVVRIPGSLSLSRAGPIAANHPDVERAAIRNLGDSAELTVRFVEGRRPTYRVEARGNRVLVILGR